ncbi:helix-turn-helix domain-containing protein [Nocardia mexicana]|uniref:Helix-turn-helix protein n=1 Tax=Nocardia mexicana TaxID=279262 RepID=A0A370GHE9_9NOCA|nr:helix-turn-helix transcriptional regulator [Nocardia mexicana]RDI42666.1 helix-turn-helix protein [Nocardia mexicana]
MSKRGSSIPRRQLGRLLRDLRQQVGLTIAAMAGLIGRSASTVQRLEAGTADCIQLEDIEAICHVADADADTVNALKGLAQQGNSTVWWHQYGDLIPANFDVYMGLESSAVRLTAFEELVPGLLQTPDYARTLIRAVHPDEPDSEIARRVDLRMRRRALITRKARPVVMAMILDESALIRTIGGRRTMGAQLRHVADMGTRPNIEIRILPHTAGVPLGDLTGPFNILDFEEKTGSIPIEPPIVYVESYTGAMYFEDGDAVGRYHAAHATLWRVALNAQESRDLLRRVAREYGA